MTPPASRPALDRDRAVLTGRRVFLGVAGGAVLMAGSLSVAAAASHPGHGAAPSDAAPAAAPDQAAPQPAQQPDGLSAPAAPPVYAAPQQPPMVVSGSS